MSDNVQMFLIGTVAVVLIAGIAVFVLRGKLRKGRFRVGADGVEGCLETHEQPKTSASRNKFDGKRNKINSCHDGSQINDNDIKGDGNQINIGRG